MPHKTTDYNSEDLMELIDRCKVQDDRVMLIFRAKAKELTPRMVFDTYRAWFPGYVILQSVRRSISDLTRFGSLKPVMEIYMDKNGNVKIWHKKIKNSLGGIEHFWSV